MAQHRKGVAIYPESRHDSGKHKVQGRGLKAKGTGRIRMLEAIHQMGPINAAAKELRMSTRAIYGRIKTTEERLGRPLLVRNVGGASGGGSKLTDFAVFLIDSFKHLNRGVEKESDRMFKNAIQEKMASDGCKCPKPPVSQEEDL